MIKMQAMHVRHSRCVKRLIQSHKTKNVFVAQTFFEKPKRHSTLSFFIFCMQWGTLSIDVSTIFILSFSKVFFLTEYLLLLHLFKNEQYKLLNQTISAGLLNAPDSGISAFPLPDRLMVLNKIVASNHRI